MSDSGFQTGWRGLRRQLVVLAATATMLLGIVGVARADVERVDDWIPYAGADAAGHCPDVTLIGARGSGQPAAELGGLGSQVWEVYEGLITGLEASELPSAHNSSIGYLDVPYRAPSVVWELLSPVGVAAYDLSVTEGVGLTHDVLERTARHCPNTHIVVAGYSAGADVIGDSLAVLDLWSEQLAGVILIADPQFFRFESSASIYGFSDHTKDGIFDGRPLPSWVSELPAYTICHPQDIVCQGVEPSNRTSIHTHSTYHGVPREAAVELGGILASVISQEAEARLSVPDGRFDGVSTFILLDRSGSMGDLDANGVVKLDGARAGLMELLEAAPGNSRFGLSIYPTPGTDCGAGQVVALLESVGANEGFIRGVEGVTAGGQTPTGEALRAVARNLPGSLGPRAVVLISDGESNCEGDACGVAKQLVNEGFDVQVHTYGFAVSAEGAAELNCISQATGGKHFGIEDAARLAVELEQLTEPTMSLQVEQIPSLGNDENPVGVVTVSVRNDGIGDALENVTLNVSIDKGDAQPLTVTHLGNINASATSRKYVWRIPVEQECGSGSVDFRVTAVAANVDAVVHSGSIDFGERSAAMLCDVVTASEIDPAPFVLSGFMSLVLIGGWMVWRP